MKSFDRAIRGATVFTPQGPVKTDIGVRDGRIAKVGSIAPEAAGDVINAAGLHVLPGVIDTQVHFRDPGLTHKEDLETGSRAAVAGGVTGVFEMPNTDPLTTTPETLAAKVARARAVMHCDFAFYVGGTVENAGHVASLERLEAAAGIKVFMGSSTGSLLVEDDAGVRAILSNAKRRVAFHSEDEMRLRARADERVAGDPASHPVWRDVETAVSSTSRLIRIARETGARIHLLHVSTADELAFFEEARGFMTCEVTPQHLTLAAPEAYEALGSFAQMNPPVREARHQAALWEAVRANRFHILGSDHAPHTLEEKERPYPQSPSGMPGVQTLVPVMLDHVSAGRLTLAQFVALTAHNLEPVFGTIGKGRIVEGYDADFTVVDLRVKRTITRDWVESRSGWSPFEGREVTGWPVGTIIRG
ncbi:MAG: dihydroorotase, partial [Pseudomonadota bacterium]